jgi:hypothetical protein
VLFTNVLRVMPFFAFPAISSLRSNPASEEGIPQGL